MVAQIVGTAVFTEKLFSKQPKKPLNILATFVRKFIKKNFQKLPNQVTLATSKFRGEWISG